MTDREKLIKLLDEKVYDDWYSNEEIADHLIANGVAVSKDKTTTQRWIPVTERLPEESGQYLVCCDDSGCPYGEGIWYQSGVVVCAQVDVGIYGGICWEWYEGSSLYELDEIVTHWMPLPSTEGIE